MALRTRFLISTCSAVGCDMAGSREGLVPSRAQCLNWWPHPQVSRPTPTGWHVPCRITGSVVGDNRGVAQEPVTGGPCGVSPGLNRVPMLPLPPRRAPDQQQPWQSRRLVAGLAGPQVRAPSDAVDTLANHCWAMLQSAFLFPWRGVYITGVCITRVCRSGVCDVYMCCWLLLSTWPLQA